MAIVSFWNNGNVETAQSMTLAGIATTIALNYNYKILMINTKFNDKSLEYAFEPKNNFGFALAKGKMDLETGFSGVAKAVLSNKTSPELITNYTSVIFKNLELLTDKNTEKSNFEKYIPYLKDIIKIANKYYDLVFVDLEGSIEDLQIREILDLSNVNVITLVQNINSLNDFIEEKNKSDVLRGDKVLVSIGKYDEKSKYTVKNIAKYIKQKRVYRIPYNTVYSMDAPEGRVPDYFIKFKRINATHVNSKFITSVNEESEAIINTIKEQQRKIY